MKIVRQSVTTMMTGQDSKMTTIQVVPFFTIFNVLDIENTSDFVEKTCRIVSSFTAPNSCSTWPTSGSTTCTGISRLKPLNRTMSISDTNNCQALCMKEIKNKTRGCCYLGEALGCFWKEDGYAEKIASTKNQIAVTCGSKQHRLN